MSPAIFVLLICLTGAMLLFVAASALSSKGRRRKSGDGVEWSAPTGDSSPAEGTSQDDFDADGGAYGGGGASGGWDDGGADGDGGDGD